MAESRRKFYSNRTRICYHLKKTALNFFKFIIPRPRAFLKQISITLTYTHCSMTPSRVAERSGAKSAATRFSTFSQFLLSCTLRRKTYFCFFRIFLYKGRSIFFAIFFTPRQSVTFWYCTFMGINNSSNPD